MLANPLRQYARTQVTFKPTHGLRKHPLYKTWAEMRYRCSNPKKDNYKHYGGRGIKVCERWHKFENFVADMGDRPTGTTLERKERNGDYEPNNCKWATKAEQMNNRSNNRIVTVDGKAMTMTQASRIWKVGVATIWARLVLHGWSDEKAVKTPARTHCANTMGIR